MTAPSRNRKLLAWAAALVLTATLVSIALGYGKEVADPVLGSEWQCRHTAFLTSCTHIAPSPVQHSLQYSPVQFRRV
jgi:hypothetical protein